MNISKKIEIMKSVWKKGPDGKWNLHDMKSLELKPKTGFSDDYFKIESTLNLLTKSPGGLGGFAELFSTFGMTEELLRRSIVPVVAWNDGDEEIRCIGTGFFISASGLLMTAAHVVRDPVDEDYTSMQPVSKGHKFGENFHMGVMLPVNPAMRNAPSELGVPLEIQARFKIQISLSFPSSGHNIGETTWKALYSM